MSVRKSSHGTIFLIVSSGSPRALIASSLRSTSKKPFCPMTRSLHPPMTACGHRVRFAATWREEFFEVPMCEKHDEIPRVDQALVHLLDKTRCERDVVILRKNAVPLLSKNSLNLLPNSDNRTPKDQKEVGTLSGTAWHRGDARADG